MQTFDIIISGNGNNDHRLEIQVELRAIDTGIGVYEYCGARGVDRHEELDIEITSAYLIHNGKRRAISVSDAMLNDVISEIEAATEQLKCDAEEYRAEAKVAAGF